MKPYELEPIEMMCKANSCEGCPGDCPSIAKAARKKLLEYINKEIILCAGDDISGRNITLHHDKFIGLLKDFGIGDSDV